jgi:hypothetical protein
MENIDISMIFFSLYTGIAMITAMLDDLTLLLPKITGFRPFAKPGSELNGKVLRIARPAFCLYLLASRSSCSRSKQRSRPSWF